MRTLKIENKICFFEVKEIFWVGKNLNKKLGRQKTFVRTKSSLAFSSAVIVEVIILGIALRRT